MRSPYPGLRPFRKEDSDFFFGRERETTDLIERLHSRRMVAVLGVSGCGKSSLVRAGLIPVLESGLADPLGGAWRVLELTPGSDPLGALGQALGLDENLPRRTHALRDWARTQPENERILLLVDQFEEIFAYRKATLETDRGNAAALFVDMLITAAREPESNLYLVLTMRTDHLGQSAVFHGLAEALNDSSYLVPRLTRMRQQEAIERPAEALGVAVEPALVQRLLNASEGDPDKLPVLQHVLKRTWEMREGGTLSIAAYERTGAWKDALANDAEHVLKDLPKETVRLVFQRITDPGSGEGPIRRPQRIAELPEVTGRPIEEIEGVIDAFSECDFMRRKGPADDRSVDLMHESVMWHWPMLQGWIEDESRTASRLRVDADMAKAKQELSGTRLEEAAGVRDRIRAYPKWAARYLSALEASTTADWIDVCQQRAAEKAEQERLRAKRELRTTRQILAGIAAALLVVGVLAFKWYETSQKLEAFSKTLNSTVQAGTGKVNPKDGLRYVFINPGKFRMGCSPGDTECFSDSETPREVDLREGFWLGQTEVTQAAYRRVTGKSPSNFQGDDLPVEQVNWTEASSYCTAVGMRLPTEEEWEYAARAGTAAARYGELDQIAWYLRNSDSKTHPVATKLPNAWLLYDMLGNVFEWTASDFAGGKAVRGGSWSGIPWVVRASYRDWVGPSFRLN